MTTQRQELKRNIDRLLSMQSSDCLSLYHDSRQHGADLSKHHVSLKSSLQEASRVLSEAGAAESQAKEMIKRLEAELPRLAELARASSGLCVLSSEQSQDIYPLPFAVEQKVIAGPRFFLRPLVAALSRPHRFYVLALSQNDARLVHVDDELATDVPFSESVPKSLEAATPTVEETHLQFHSGGGDAPAYHGQRPGERRKDEDLKRYLSQVANEVARLVKPESAPLVLAGVPELTAKFRALSSSRVAAQELRGNFDEVSCVELARAARPHAEVELSLTARSACQKAMELQATELVVEEIPQVLRAAHDGQVATLLLRSEGVVWGNYDPKTREPHFSATPDEGSVDLLNLAAVKSYNNGAQVFVVDEEEMPETPRPAVAILRYAS